MSISHLFSTNKYNARLNTLRIEKSTISTDTSTGSLVVNGGIGVGGILRVGGGIFGAITSTSGSSFVSSYPSPALSLSDSGNPTIGHFRVNPTGPTLEYDRAFHITNSAASSDITSGALVVDGGIGVANNVNIGGNLLTNGVCHIQNTTVSSDNTTGALIIDGGVGIANNINIGGNLLVDGTITCKTLEYEKTSVIQSTENSVSDTTGALTVAGGVGIAKDVYIGGTIHAAGGIPPAFDYSAQISLTNTTQSISDTTGALTLAGGVGIAKDVYIGGTIHAAGGIPPAFDYSAQISLTNTIQSTNITTGALIVSGGAGIGGDVYVGGTIHAVSGLFDPSAVLNLTNTTQTTNITTGALTLAGGAGISKNLYVGGNINVSGSSTSNSISTDGINSYGGITVHSSHIGLRTATTSVDEGNDVVTYSTSAYHSSFTNNGDEFLRYDAAGTTYTTLPQITTVTNTAASTSISSGALKVSGGAGIAKKLYVGDEVHCISTVNSSGVTSGSLIVSGGAGIASNLNVGGALNLVSGISATSTSTGALVISGGLGCSEQVFAYSFTADNSVTSQGLYCTGQLQQFSDVYVKTTTTPQMNIVYGTSLDPNTHKTTMTTDSGGNFLLDCTGGSFETGNLFKVKITTESSSTSTGALQVRGGAGIAKKLYVGGSLSGNDATFTNTTTPLSLNYDVTNKTTFSISSGGDLTIDATGNDINFHSTDNVHILNTTASTSISTGSLVVSGGAGFAGAIYSGSNFFIAPSVNLIKESQLLGAVRTTGAGTDATIVTNGSFAFYSFVNGAIRNLYTSWDTAHEYKLGSTITPHVHIFFDNVAAGRVDFQLTYNIAEVDNGFDFTGTNLTTVSQTNDIANPTRHYMLELGGFAGPTNVGGIVNMRLRRLGTTDTYTQPVYLASWGLHWYVDKLGNLT